ncbi:MAG: rhomboid family intramembrane serine protease [Bryobacteraceae bacterium]
MLADRRYTHSNWSNSEYLPPGVKWLLIVNVALFIPFELSSVIRQHLLLLSLAPAAVIEKFAVWQLATYMFLHGGVGHVLFNMLSLWMFGTPLERDWGTRRFLKYYFLCGIGAGLCDVALNAALGHWRTHTIGASGAIYGLLLAFGVMYPNQTVLFSFLFPIKAKYMVMIVGAIAFLGAFRINSGVSDIAHLGGMAFGFAFLRLRFVKWKSGYLQREFNEWRLRRARKRFQVYLRKNRSDRDTWVN